MRRGRSQRGDRGVLAVPVLPGDTYVPPPPIEPGQSRRRRGLLLTAAVVGLVAIVIATLLLRHSSDKTAAQQTTTAVVTTIAATTTPASRPAKSFAAQRAARLALTIAAKLPMSLETTALLRKGTSMYAVGGTTRNGKPTAAIWRIDLKTHRAQHWGTFIEPLTDAGATSKGSVLYLAGGWTGEKLATGVLRWTPGETATVVARLPHALRGASAAFAAGKIFVVKGAAKYSVDVTAGTVTELTKRPALPAALSNQSFLALSLQAAAK